MLPDTPINDRPADRPADDNRPSTSPDGIAELPAGAGADDALAELYTWPEPGTGPVVRANMIMSLDGGTTVRERSAGLGNAADEQLFAVLRDLAEVVLVGSGTVRAEGYRGIRLDAHRQARRKRWGLPAEPPPIAVVTANGLEPTLPFFTDTVTPPIVITTRDIAESVPAPAQAIVTGIERVNLTAAIGSLADAGYRRIHCEGGPSLLAGLVADDLLDELCLTIAPMLTGSSSTPMLPVALPGPVTWTLTGARAGGDHLFTRYLRAIPR